MEKQFAVIYFPTENIYSEVPSAWLTSDKKQCWWPNSLNARSLMMRRELPDKAAWNLHEIKLEEYASTLESARRKAENPAYLTGGEELIVEKRHRKPRVHSSSSSELNFTPPPSPKAKKKKASKKAAEKIELTLKEKQILDPTQVCQGYEVLACGDANSSDETQSQYNRIHELANVETQNVKGNCTCFCTSEGSQVLKDVLLSVEKLSIACSSIQKYVLSIDNRLKGITLEQGNVIVDDVMKNISNHLPLKVVEDIPKFDDIFLDKDEAKAAYIRYIKRIGGRDFKDHINRCLPKLFTNELGKQCSYVGLRGNFKLQQFNFMKIFVDVIVVQHSCSLHEVEKCIGEWFRLANQRNKRINKNNIPLF